MDIKKVIVAFYTKNVFIPKVTFNYDTATKQTFFAKYEPP